MTKNNCCNNKHASITIILL